MNIIFISFFCLEGESMKRVLIADRAQKRLAYQIAQSIGVDLIEVDTIHFTDTEIKPVLADENNQLFGSHAIIVHSTNRFVNDNLIWIWLLCDKVRSKGVKKISVMIPYFGYGRQDLYDDGSEGPGCAIMRLLECAGISEIITVELHAPALQKVVSSMQIYNIQLNSFIAEWIAKEYPVKDLTIVAPDKGSAERAQYIADQLNVPLLRATKERFGPDQTRLLSLSDRCKTDYALIVDDIIDTGATALHVIKEIRASNNSCNIDLFAIHPVLSNNASEALQASFVDKVWVTNSIELYDEQLFEKLRIVDIGPLLVKVLHEIC